jgi:hypothetical protein
VIAATDENLAQVEARDHEHVERKTEQERRQCHLDEPGPVLAGRQRRPEHRERLCRDREHERDADGRRLPIAQDGRQQQEPEPEREHQQPDPGPLPAEQGQPRPEDRGARDPSEARRRPRLPPSAFAVNGNPRREEEAEHYPDQAVDHEQDP